MYYARESKKKFKKKTRKRQEGTVETSGGFYGVSKQRETEEAYTDQFLMSRKYPDKQRETGQCKAEAGAGYQEVY